MLGRVTLYLLGKLTFPPNYFKNLSKYYRQKISSKGCTSFIRGVREKVIRCFKLVLLYNYINFQIKVNYYKFRIPDEVYSKSIISYKCRHFIFRMNVYDDNHSLSTPKNEMDHLIHTALWIERYTSNNEENE